MTNKNFRLNTPTLALEAVQGKLTAVTIPQHEIIRVSGEPSVVNSDMLDVEWCGRRLVVFAIDVQQRCEEVHESTEA